MNEQSIERPDETGVPPMTGVVVESEARDEDFLTRLTQAARDNPASAALIALGAAWLLAGGAGVSIRGGRHDGARGRAFGRGAPAGYPPYPPYPYSYGYPGALPSGGEAGLRASPPEGLRAGAEGLGRGAEAAGEAARRAGGAVGRTVEAAGRTVARAGEEAAHVASDVASGLGQGLSGAARLGYRGVSQATRSTTDAVSHASHAAWIETQAFGQSTREYLEERPLAIGALGLAAGVGLALALPRTRAEEEWLGETSESLRSEARRRVVDGLDEARRSADDIAKRVIRDAQAHGLSQDAIAAAVQELKVKLEKAALAGKDAAVEEFAGGAGSKPEPR